MPVEKDRDGYFLYQDVTALRGCRLLSVHTRPAMDENVIEIKKQVRKIIELLEQRIILEPNRPILKTLYDRYMKAEEIISSNEDISKIMISGGCRAYLDAFSDYMNPLLGEMDKAEKMLSNLKK